jgi:hypothetical protein
MRKNIGSLVLGLLFAAGCAHTPNVSTTPTLPTVPNLPTMPSNPKPVRPVSTSNAAPIAPYRGEVCYVCSERAYNILNHFDIIIPGLSYKQLFTMFDVINDDDNINVEKLCLEEERKVITTFVADNEKETDYLRVLDSEEQIELIRFADIYYRALRGEYCQD